MLLSDPLGKIAREHGAHYDRIRHVLPIFEWIAGESTIRPIAARMLGDVRGGVVLDVGSNVGQNMLHLYRSVGDQGHIVGIDTAHACVQLARRKADARGLDNIHYVVDDAHRYRSDTLFDGILMGYCCNVLTDPALAIAQLLGQLRTGKRLVICDARIPPGLQNTAAEKFAARFARSFLKADPSRDPIRIMHAFAREGLVRAVCHHNCRFTYASAWEKI